MNKKLINTIVKVLVGLSVLVIVGLGIYALITIKQNEKTENANDVLSYLNNTYQNELVSSKSPLLGFLNYNFDSVDTNLSNDELLKTNLFASSQMNSDGIDEIYISKFGVTKSAYENKTNYVSNPESNCYYNETVLKKNFNCNSVCSSSEINIMKSIANNLKWVNVLPEDAQTYCIKNAVYPIENDGYFVNINDIKTIYNNITNKDLTINSDIKSNNYYEYGAYLVTNNNNIEDGISKISSIESINIKDNNYVVEYTALTDLNKVLKGTVTLEKNEDKYYLVANKIETSYNMN